MSTNTNKGVNIQRHLLSKTTSYDDDIADIRSSSKGPFFLRAVVVDVVFHPSRNFEALKEKWGSDMIRPTLLNLAPHDSILARVVSNASDRRIDAISLFYPMMSHTREPIKPGEQVWIFYENEVADVGFWVSRIKEPLHVDDPNFTHADRKFVDAGQTSAFERFDKAKQLDSLSEDERKRLQNAGGSGPLFPNGADTQESMTLGTIDAYEVINEESIANAVITKELVPRFNKRPGDWAAEGSNNTLFVLGEDRSSSASQNEVTGKRGAFDLVLGRGMMPETAPEEITNARGLKETNKSLDTLNDAEGDPDFENDLVRVYGSMLTDVDGNFGKQLPKLNAGIEPEQVGLAPATIIKTTHNRIISRKDGTIRIIKEGVLDDDHASIVIEKDGTVMIDSRKIIIGSGVTNANGSGDQIFLGRDATESITLGDTLKSLLDEYTGNIDSHMARFADSINDAVSQFTVPPGNFGNFGSPVPGVVGIGQALIDTSQALKKSVKETTKSFRDNTHTILSQNGKTK